MCLQDNNHANEFWYNFTGGMLIHPTPAQDSMRLNGADATYNGGSIVELTWAGQTPKWGVSLSTSSQSS